MRKITSLTLAVAGFIELVTSVVLYCLPSGRVAYWTDYHLLGLTKTQWGNMHIAVGFLLLVLAAVHLYYNWRPLLAYLKNKAKGFTFFNKSFAAALFISLYVALGSLYNLPPMNYILQLGEQVTEAANKKYGEPPYGHAELSSLKMFCRKMDIDVELAKKRLADAGIRMNGKEESILAIARHNGRSPQQLFDLFKNAARLPEAGKGTLFPDSPPPGFGNQSLVDVCRRYALPVDEVMEKLRQKGFAARGEETIREISGRNVGSPMAIFELLKETASTKK